LILPLDLLLSSPVAVQLPISLHLITRWITQSPAQFQC
jgi:hypothetical protein